MTPAVQLSFIPVSKLNFALSTSFKCMKNCLKPEPALSSFPPFDGTRLRRAPGCH